jgi:hypothetical protein
VQFVGSQVQYSWIDGQGVHTLLVRIEAADGDLQVAPVSYTVEGAPGDLEALRERLFRIREGLLLNSIAPGEFYMARVASSPTNLELVFLVPPR